MKHLTEGTCSVPPKEVLANWATVAAFIYEDDVATEDIVALLRFELLNKNRDMIVERLITRYLNLLKIYQRYEIDKDIRELRALHE